MGSLFHLVLLAAIPPLERSAGDAQQIPSWLMPAFIVYTIFSLTWTSAISLAIYRMSKTDRSTDGLKAELHQANIKLLDERDRRISHQIAHHAQEVANAMIEIGEHAKATHEREMELVKALGDARDFVRVNAADKREFSEFCKEVRDGREKMLQAFASLERQVVTGDDLRKILQEVRRGA